MNIPQDKKKHFVAGFAITAVVSLFFGYIVGAIAAVATYVAVSWVFGVFVGT